MSIALPVCLETAVMLRIREIKQSGYISDYLLESVKETADLIAYSGDTLLFDNKKAGAIFNKVALAVAVMSFQSGGVQIFGFKFESVFEL
ncbi:hypothetical protein FD723_18550 [Nostoc sp. C052]|uniref:hypothetical protein n=1 Tax=Nostoc sp. C052 TaxID=2576902 RepID=UPI0015C3BF98|nr:hypothetical protein [Nostoc sp. C052]QLE42221.1 hypothetical protein FD723_18550 [Nostoc sp. C052]